MVFVMTIFVFGSNLAGRHGKGSALEAVMNHGAIYGQGWGRQGNSYAIPTKDYNLKRLPLGMIHHFARDFIRYARENPTETFKMVAIGCGLAGYKPKDIAPLFDHAPNNVILPYEFQY
jgi:hypothetical protein